MFRKDLGGGFVIVPVAAVSVAGRYIKRLNESLKDYAGEVCLLLPDGKAEMDIDGKRRRVYASVKDCEEEAEVLKDLLEEPLRYNKYLKTMR